MAEGRTHLRLKTLAAAYLRAEGFPVVGFEVAGPIGRHRIDVAGWSDRHAPEREPLTVFIECKASREDFVRDRRHLGRLQRERDRLEAEREWLERNRLRRREPELRLGGATLFPEMDEWAWEASRDPAYRRCLRRLRRVTEQIHGETKFFVFERYRLADRLFLAAPRGVLRPRDLPPGWGLLEADPDRLEPSAPLGPDLFGGASMAVRVRAPAIRRAAGRFRDRTLRNLAAATTRDALRPHGIGPASLVPPSSPAPPAATDEGGEGSGLTEDALRGRDPDRGDRSPRSPRGRGSSGPEVAWNPVADAWRAPSAADGAPVGGRVGRREASRRPSRARSEDAD